MKLTVIVTLFPLIIMVKGAWLTAVQPVILSIGALFSAINLDVELLNEHFMGWKKWIGIEELNKEKK